MNELKQLEPKQAELLVLTQVRKHLGQSHLLQKLGFEVAIQVCRLPEATGRKLAMLEAKVPSSSQVKSEMKNMTVDAAVPFYQLRAEQEKNAELASDGTHASYEAHMRHSYVYPKGGYTKVEFVHPITGKKYVGECPSMCTPSLIRSLLMLAHSARCIAKCLLIAASGSNMPNTSCLV